MKHLIDEEQIQELFDQISDLFIKKDVNPFIELSVLAIAASNVAIAAEITGKIPDCKNKFIQIYLEVWERFNNSPGIQEIARDYSSKQSDSVVFSEALKKRGIQPKGKG